MKFIYYLKFQICSVRCRCRIGPGETGMFVVRIITVQAEFQGNDADDVNETRYRPGEYAEIFSELGFPGFDESDDFPGCERVNEGDSRILILDEGNGRSFIISDSPHRYDKTSQSIEIALDPRNAFGDGRHPTTEICIHLLGRILWGMTSSERNNTRLLDAGTGSGILSILAARMGIETIDAVDLSRDAVRSAVSNARLNRCEFRISCADIGNFEFSDKYGIIMANMVTDVLEAHMASLASMLSDNGVMIASGISVMNAERARDAFLNNGFTVINYLVWKGWMGFELRRSN